MCLHEEDAGLLWKHTELRTGHCEQRRGRRLVLSSICTLGNYVRVHCVSSWRRTVPLHGTGTPLCDIGNVDACGGVFWMRCLRGKHANERICGLA